jgi:aminopeptidase YwaD
LPALPGLATLASTTWSAIMPKTSLLKPLSPSDFDHDWRMLVETIGERRAGSAAEHQAAQYIFEQFERAGLQNARLEAFACKSLRSAKASLEVADGGGWTKVPCEILVGSPSTDPAEMPVERELVWIEMPEQAGRLKPGAFKGKALLLFGPLATDTKNHRAIVRSGADLVIWVDDRLPFEWAKADGLLPAWAKRYGVLPTIAIAFRTGYQWRVQGAKRVRVCVQTDVSDETSYNVVADVPGSDQKLGVVAFGCHYDTQIGNPGADDNASGTVSVLALARAFAAAAKQKPFARTVRFIAFGTEEQLSVGSRAYVLAHQPEMKLHALMINLDSLSSALAHTSVLVAGSPELRRWIVRQLESAGISVRISDEITPFADHFPFTIFGVPAFFVHRSNCPGGRWQHHSIYDTLETVSGEELAKLVTAVGALAANVAHSRTLPFKRGIQPKDRPEIKRLARELFEI